jgi:hypothetical protein
MFFKPGMMGKPNAGGSALGSLLHMNGADASSVFTDEYGLTWTNSNSPVITTAQSVFGGASGDFTAFNAYITSDVSPVFTFGLDDLTIAGWFRATDFSNIRYFVYFTGHTSTYFEINTSNQLRCVVAGQAISTAASVLSVDTWHSVALCRVAGVFYAFLDGVLFGTYAPPIDLAAASAMRLGAAANSSRAFNGQLDEWYVLNGVGLYTSDYTPTGPFPNP